MKKYIDIETEQNLLEFARKSTEITDKELEMILPIIFEINKKESTNLLGEDNFVYEELINFYPNYFTDSEYGPSPNEAMRIFLKFIPNRYSTRHIISIKILEIKSINKLI